MRAALVGLLMLACGASEGAQQPELDEASAGQPSVAALASVGGAQDAAPVPAPTAAPTASTPVAAPTSTGASGAPSAIAGAPSLAGMGGSSGAAVGGSGGKQDATDDGARAGAGGTGGETVAAAGGLGGMGGSNVGGVGGMASTPADDGCAQHQLLCRGSGCEDIGLPACWDDRDCPQDPSVCRIRKSECDGFWDVLVPADWCVAVLRDTVGAADDCSDGGDGTSCRTVCAKDAPRTLTLRASGDATSKAPWGFVAYFAPRLGASGPEVNSPTSCVPPMPAQQPWSCSLMCGLGDNNGAAPGCGGDVPDCRVHEPTTWWESYPEGGLYE